MSPPEEPFRQLLLGRWNEAAMKPWNDPVAILKLAEASGESYAVRIFKRPQYAAPQIRTLALHWLYGRCTYCNGWIEEHNGLNGKCLYGAETYTPQFLLTLLHQVYVRDDITGVHVALWHHYGFADRLFAGSELPDAKKLE